MLTDLNERVSHCIGWLSPVVDQRNAALDLLEPEHDETLHEFASMLDRIAHDARRLTGRVRGLALDHDGDQDASASTT